MTVSAQGKAVFHWSSRFISPQSPRLSQRALEWKVQFSFSPLDGPFKPRVLVPIPLCHYRHHCPQNGWQLLEVPGCVTTLRCTCCAIYVPPVLLHQQPERQRLQQHEQPINAARRYCIKATGLMTTLIKTSASETGSDYIWFFCQVIYFHKTTQKIPRSRFFPIYSVDTFKIIRPFI